MEEVWKSIEGYEDYFVSNLGRVKRKRRKLKGYRILNPVLQNTGYYTVGLRGKTVSVHRLVAQAFIPNPDNKPCVDHINTIRNDNVVSNLRWVTHSENTLNPITTKRRIEVNIGKTLSEETKDKIRQAHLGKTLGPMSEETKRKISEARKRYWEKKRLVL